MDWQLPLVGGLVALAAAYLLRSSWRTWARQKNGCGGGCGCAKSAVEPRPGTQHETFIPVQQLSLRQRTPAERG